MRNSNLQEADGHPARDPKDPFKADWRHDGQIEYEIDETAGVVIVEVETLAIVYDLTSRTMIRAGWDESCFDLRWRKVVSAAIDRRLVEFIKNDFDQDVFIGHGLSGVLLDSFLSDLEYGLRCTSLFWEDVIGITIIPGTIKVKLHFSQEGINNGSNSA